MRRIILALAVVGCIFAFSVPAHAEPYVSAYFGAAMPHDSDVSDNTGLGFTGEFTFDTGIAAGAKIGWMARVAGLELDFNWHESDLDEITADSFGVGVDAEMKVYSATANLIFRYPGETIRPYIGAGGGYFRGKINNVGVQDETFAGDDDEEWGWQALAGIDFLVTPSISLFAEYKYSRVDFSFGGEIEVDIDYEVSQAYGGVSYHF
ncbi:MAG: porin family protein [Deltaproteobacteria bacterium]|nr:porin family protein [Deltaproteobacteria bacterium]MBZ0219436.1 porin family protein [Deltaproteobacteria bacterium]